MTSGVYMCSGTLPWTAAHDRLTLFYKFSPHGVAHNATFFNSEQFRSMCTGHTLALDFASFIKESFAFRSGDDGA